MNWLSPQARASRRECSNKNGSRHASRTPARPDSTGGSPKRSANAVRPDQQCLLRRNQEDLSRRWRGLSQTFHPAVADFVRSLRAAVDKNVQDRRRELNSAIPHGGQQFYEVRGILIQGVAIPETRRDPQTTGGGRVARTHHRKRRTSIRRIRTRNPRTTEASSRGRKVNKSSSRSGRT